MSKDLFGNNIESAKLTSTQRIVTRQNVSLRDLYTTEPKDIERFLSAIKRDKVIIPSPIWESAAGHGDISKTLLCSGYSVFSSDIIPYEDKNSDFIVTDLDFFTCTKLPSVLGNECKTIFTNPPFNMQEDFLLHALSFGVDVIFFVRLSFLSSIRRYKIYKQYKPCYVYVYSARAHCYKAGDVSHGQNMVDYCVMMWKPPHEAETIVRWIE